MSYTSVQFIGYEVPTGVGLPAGACDYTQLEICKALLEDDDFTGLVGKLSKDLQNRLGRMLAVAQLALMKGEDDPHTLKVFVAPEFYFRPEKAGDATPSRSYPSAELFALLAALRRVFTQKDLMEHWLFVLGTAVWNQTGEVVLKDVFDAKSAAEIFGNGAKQDDVYNVAFVDKMKRKPIVYNTVLVANGGHGIHVYDKLHYSGDDAIDVEYRAQIQQDKNAADYQDKASSFDQAVNDEEWSGRQARLALYDYFEISRLLNRRGCIVSADNLYCGLEICLDHENQVLKKEYNDWAKTFVKPLAAPALDFSLLTACGMAVQRGSLKIAKNRAIFRVDGAISQPPGAVRFDHSEIQVKAAGIQLISPEDDLDAWKKLNGSAEAIPLADELLLDVTGQVGYRKNAQNVLEEKQLGDVFPQRLVVYQPTKLTHLL